MYLCGFPDFFFFFFEEGERKELILKQEEAKTGKRTTKGETDEAAR